MLKDLIIFSTFVKLLLFPTYRSTDFEVHRNWLAITHSLPISKWYYEDRSEWTLDYPPFFAWFEWILSQFAPLADKEMLRVDNLNYTSDATIYFQRATVIISELVLFYALKKYLTTNNMKNKNLLNILAASIFLNPGILIVDHIHFQYNGFLYGIFLLSLAYAKEGNDLMCGIMFAVLLNFKHIFLYLAPAYFVYLLRHYCFQETSIQGTKKFSLKHFFFLGVSVIIIFLLSFGPFIIMGQLGQVLSRLFPFKRGLCHAYWAPNFWALYSAMDRVLIVFAKRLGWTLNESAIGSITRGLVGDVNFALLPQVKANHTFILTLIFQMASLVKLWKRPSYKNFLVSLILNGYSSFLFGWHVHEKAILLVMIPFSLISADNIALFRSYMILAVSGLYSLFPLLFKLTESTIKIVICLLWFILTFMGILSNLNYKRNNIKKYSQSNESKLSYLIKIIENIYMYGFIILQFFTGIVHQIIYKDGKYPFLPLLSTSIYCAFGVIYSWIRLSVIYFLGKDDENQEVNS
ncbi:dolichyl pyrophosphate Glc1Man9GlcNAc2 alpha-1,3-glucosyltransferase [Rhizophagus irregularis DAOM 181602=DAOM 197198]|uniref:Alpha-1,3-glucosyltransferase n=2 Tax=Rhizophagus irregularis TaxID=588596 RepID=A0A015LX48_RHIIW|nr:glycosyltransferase family 57 protein [Rhizophagus irregularis DAOM 181602=DAOM 197198]EXX77256.1 dolichyl-P-Glc:Glc1Man(9)GlcNAc(2)-PP-dolichol alpha-1,3-glucosyltransferase [Rhizophagus irregularis DAOM 197198w]POG74993.1 glycosyltransferase family 57 protein [Rhizophagus irregularis DAOM 181602=DAOM 197198]GET51148.1 dolichyl pyrophosphate Glc1Man9GlcNAc2 alpha-1,3-glucosyltransferase [Rhizophagus irregularis DAOM 181602=DAOM 197198]|eukprot:XP_025181859.1 glycosyltransferase family 57 protein [Rhizophagus irregularis DAOM 181602=DAOM 197198]